MAVVMFTAGIQSAHAYRGQEEKPLGIETSSKENGVEVVSCDTYGEKTVISKLDNIGFNAKFNLVQILFHGLSDYMGGGYDLDVGPSFEGNLITRTDHYYFELNHDLILRAFHGKIPFAFDLGANARIEAEYDRQFTNPCLANQLKSRYGEEENPFSAQNVIDKLNVGDYFAMKTHWQLAPGLELSKLLGIVTVSIGEHQLLSGDFQFHFVKESPTKVRIKVVGFKSAGQSTTVLNISLYANRVFAALGFVNGFFHRIFNNILDLTYVSEADNVTMLEMLVDLSDPNAFAAYNQMLEMTSENQTAFTDLVYPKKIVFNKFEWSEDIAAELKPGVFINIEPLHDLALQHSPAVVENFRASDIVSARRDPKTAGLTLIAGGQGTAEAEHHKITTLNVNGKREFYQSDSFHSRSEVRGELNYKVSISDQSLHLLSLSDENFHRTKYLELVEALELRQKQFLPRDFEQTLRVLSRSVTTPIYEQIKSVIDSNWKNSSAEHRNAHALLQVAIHGDTLNALPTLAQEQVEVLFRKYLYSADLSGDEVVRELLTGEALQAAMAQTKPENHARAMDILKPDIKKIIVNLTTLLDKNNKSLDERAAAFSKLQNIPLFIHIGSAFMISLLPEPRISDFISVNFVLEDADGSRASFELAGQKTIDPLYVEVLKIQNILNDSGRDLKLEGIKLVTRPAAKPSPKSLTASALMSTN